MRLSVGAASLAGRTNDCTVSDNQPSGVASESTQKEWPLALLSRLVRTMGLEPIPPCTGSYCLVCFH
jgi:hypothetical protein